MTANISSLCREIGEQKLPCNGFFLCATNIPCPLPALPSVVSLGSRAKQGYFLAGPDLMLAVGLVSLPACGKGELMALPPPESYPPSPSPNSVALPSCIFVWRLSSEMTISMRQRLAELRQRQRGSKQQGPSSPQRAAAPSR